MRGVKLYKTGIVVGCGGMDYSKFTRELEPLHLMVARDVGGESAGHDTVTGYSSLYVREMLAYARERNVYVEVVWEPKFALNVYEVECDAVRAAEVQRLVAAPYGSTSLISVAMRDLSINFGMLREYETALREIAAILFLVGGSGRDKTVRVYGHPLAARVVINIEVYDGTRNVLGMECLSRLYRVAGVKDITIGILQAPGRGIFLWVS